MDQREFIKFKQPRDFGQILGTTFQYIRQNFKSLALSVYAIGLPLTILASFLMGSFYSNILSENAPGIGGSISAIVGYFLFVLSFIAVYAAIIEHARLYMNNRESQIDMAMVWAGVRQRFLPYLGATFLIGLMIVLAPLLGALMFLFGSGTAVMVIFIFIEIILYLFAIFLAVKTAFTYIVISHEERGVVDSIKRSFWATDNKWWFTFGLGVVANIIQSAISSIVFLPLYIIFIFVMFLGLEGGGTPFGEENSWFGIMISVMMFIYLGITLLTYCIPAVALTLQFHSVVEEREGEGLADRIAAFDAPEEEVDPESLL